MSSRISKLAVRCEQDGFDTTRKELMGRHVAGSSFLRAIYADYVSGTDKLYGCTQSSEAFQAFRRFTKDHSSGIEPEWVRPEQRNLLCEIGTLHFPDPNLRDPASLRLRGLPNDYSITGLTHTTASFNAMDMIRSLATTPIMPWDALICTSQSVKSTVTTILEAEQDYLKWRLGVPKLSWVCKLPVIPLGLHVQDFELDLSQKKVARRQLGIEEDELVFMFIGRLNPFVKANPLAMYQALEAAAKKTRQKVTLIECGWFHAEQVKQMQQDARKLLAPGIKYIHIDGRVERDKWNCWSASDIFISLSDNIQETFGLTPVEAMAAGKPCIISDWNGYRELIEDGEQGFRIPTSMPDETDPYAHAYETGVDYGRYCAGVSHSTQVDIRVLTERITQLITNSDLRAKMGEMGKLRAKTKYDWSVVYPEYQRLWSELSKIRLAAKTAQRDAPPRALPSRLPPSKTFKTYPTQFLTDDTTVKVVDGKSISDYEKFAKIQLTQITLFQLPNAATVAHLFNHSGKTIKSIATDTDNTTFWVKRVVGTLLKWGLFEIVEKDQS